jgi:hypothetical protein
MLCFIVQAPGGGVSRKSGKCLFQATQLARPNKSLKHMNTEKKF